MYLISAAVGRVLKTLPDGGPIAGVALLDNLLYVLRSGKSSEQIEIYETESYSLQRRLPDTKCGSRTTDIVSCEHYRCVYVSNDLTNSVHRLAVSSAATRNESSWKVNNTPTRLSVTDTHNVLVTCRQARKIKEYTTHGKLVRELQLTGDITSPLHTVQAPSGEYIVCHGDYDDPLRRVCLLGSDGQVLASYGAPGEQMNVPFHLAVARSGFIFVADYENGRVLLLSPSLTCVREVVSRDKFKCNPVRLCSDVDRSRLYVADDSH